MDWPLPPKSEDKGSLPKIKHVGYSQCYFEGNK